MIALAFLVGVGVGAVLTFLVALWALGDSLMEHDR